LIVNKKSLKNFVALIMLGFLCACTTESVHEPMDKVTVQLVWKHQAQFAGFYAADKNGFYENENLEVSILPRRSPSFDVVNAVVKGDADFGVNYAVGLIEARNRKQPVTAIASIYKRYPLAFMSLKEKGIVHPLDFVGRRFPVLSVSGASVLFDALLKKNRVTREDIVFIQTGYDLNRLFTGEVDVWTGYTINEVLIAKQKGYEINLVKPGDFGVNMMGDTLFTSDILINTNPDLVLRFVRATVKGWQWAVEHPEDAAKMCLEFDNELDLNHQTAMMKTSIPYIKSQGPVGMMDTKVWEEMYKTLLDQEIIESRLNLNTVYINSFVEQFYREK
jgi:NitT/TauT family transport system substrate-binding protein